MLTAEHSETDQASQVGIGKLANYTLLHTIGDTHLNPVYLARKDNTEKTVVIKTMHLNDESFLNECQIFSLPPHDSIIKSEELFKEALVEFRPEDRSVFTLKEGGLRNVIVMELAENGDFFAYLLKGPFTESIARYYFEQILDAIEHLHNNNYCHLDLKIENVLLNKDFNIKLTDFGFSTQFEEGKRLHKKAGTSSCRPPEMWKFGSEFLGFDGVKTDIFQLGVLLYIFIVGVPPFAEAHYGDLWYRPLIAEKRELFWSLKDKAAKLKKQIPQVLNPDFKALIDELLCADGCLRPTIQGIRESAWFKKTLPATTEEVFKEMSTRKSK